jgi:hypothetical protein
MNDTPKPNPEALDEENPQLTPEELQRARPAKEFFGEQRLRRMVGGPRPRRNASRRPCASRPTCWRR